MVLFDKFICCLPCTMDLIAFITPETIVCLDERNVMCVCDTLVHVPLTVDLMSNYLLHLRLV